MPGVSFVTYSVRVTVSMSRAPATESREGRRREQQDAEAAEPVEHLSPHQQCLRVRVEARITVAPVVVMPPFPRTAR